MTNKYSIYSIFYLHGAHFSAHFISIWAPHTNVGWCH